MSEDAPARLSIRWSTHARDELRAIDRDSALNILHCVDRYLLMRDGDIKKLRPPMSGFRLRCGDYRVFFRQDGEQGIAATGVRHRQDAYR